MTSTCPNGHTSESTDYCDVCGAPISAGAPAASPAGPGSPSPTETRAASPAPSGLVCPNCETPNVPDALFCEACGYDFTTGTMPRSAVPLTPPDGELPDPGVVDASMAPGEVPQPTGSTAAAPASQPPGDDAAHASAGGPIRWVAEVWIDPAWYDAQESPDALPSAGLPAVVPLRTSSVLVGRKSKSRNINPDIDCEPDTGTSRRQAQLTTDGTRWWVEDLGSSNGTFVGAASEPLPEDPIPVGPKRELRSDDRVYVGAWTRLVIREATEDEVASMS